MHAFAGRQALNLPHNAFNLLTSGADKYTRSNVVVVLGANEISESEILNRNELNVTSLCRGLGYLLCAGHVLSP
jgi:hypothetical protein